MSKTTPPQLLADPEVEAQPRRRSFTGEYKARILAECDAVTEPGDIGAILRREGLYSSHLTDWRHRRAEGGAAALAPKKVGRPAKGDSQRANEKKLAKLERENAALQEKLRRAAIIIDAQKKFAAMMDTLQTLGRDE
jgi:transposase